MSSKIDDVVSQPKLLIKPRNEFEEFEMMKQAQNILKKEIELIKKTIKGDTSNMLQLMQDLDKMYKKSYNNENEPEIIKEGRQGKGSLDFQNIMEDHDMLKRKVELINSKEHSLSQRLMNVEDRVLIVLDKKPAGAMHHQGIGKHEFLALKTVVNELQQTCKTNDDTKSGIDQKEIIELKEDQKLIKKELFGLQGLVKNETFNTFTILKDLNAKIDYKNNNSIEAKENILDGIQNTAPSGLEGFYSVDTQNNKKRIVDECMERIDRIALGQRSLNDSLGKRVDALFENEQKALDRLSRMESEIKDTRNYYIHEGPDASRDAYKNDSSLHFQLIDEHKKSLTPESNAPVNKEMRGVS